MLEFPSRTSASTPRYWSSQSLGWPPGTRISKAPRPVSFGHEQFYPFTHVAEEKGKKIVFLRGIAELRRCPCSNLTETAELVCRVVVPVHTSVANAEFFVPKQCAALALNNVGFSIRLENGLEPVSAHELCDLCVISGRLPTLHIGLRVLLCQKGIIIVCSIFQRYFED